LTTGAGSRTNARVKNPEDQIGELERSRRRLLQASDHERRRVERALHDGPQQHLIALCVHLQLARELLRADPGAAGALLEELQTETRAALRELQSLAQDVYPPLLAERGAIEALRAAASELGVRADVRPAPKRQPAEVEAGLYFTCLEALRVIGSEPDAARDATVRAWLEGRDLVFEVTGDGPNWAAAATAAACDRIAALGGRLEQAPGRLSGRIPSLPPTGT
jgi:signal transduction histidine kinase